jgi:CheY-like chemotaxis protein
VPKTVMIADDSATIKKAFELTFLGIDDVEIITAGSAVEALETARDRRPDLIIADSHLGDASGYDFCKTIKGEADLKDIPLWIMTGPFERLDDGQYDACGAEGHVRKPFDTQRLIDAVMSMHAPPEEEKARPSYPAAASVSSARPLIPTAGAPLGAKAPPKPPPAPGPKPPAAVPVTPKAAGTLHGHAPPAISDSRRVGKATIMGGPFVPPVRPQTPTHPLPAEPKPVAPVAKPAARPLDQTMRPHAMPAAEKAAPAEGPAEAVLSADAARAFLDSLNPRQKEEFMTILREVVERVVWEVVPEIAEAIIKEELNRLLKE